MNQVENNPPKAFGFLVHELATSVWPKNISDFENALGQIGAQIRRIDLIRKMDREFSGLFE